MVSHDHMKTGQTPRILAYDTGDAIRDQSILHAERLVSLHKPLLIPLSVVRVYVN